VSAAAISAVRMTVACPECRMLIDVGLGAGLPCADGVLGYSIKPVTYALGMHLRYGCTQR
jgi:hypothetical protein